MVFACLMLSVFATIDAYERTASAVLFYMVSFCLYFFCFPEAAAATQAQVRASGEKQAEIESIGPVNSEARSNWQPSEAERERKERTDNNKTKSVKTTRPAGDCHGELVHA